VALDGGLLGREVAAGLDRPPARAFSDSIALVKQMTALISRSQSRNGMNSFQAFSRSRITAA
jgi:hypothetical protein